MFDFVKGLGMIQIVLFHTTPVASVSKWILFIINAFGFGLMGVYLAINGFQFRETKIKLSVKKFSKTYLVPYVQLAIITLVCLLLSNYPWYRTLPALLKVVSDYAATFALGTFNERTIGPFLVRSVLIGWFFLALFWGSILLNLILKIKNCFVRMACVAMIAAIGIYLETKTLDFYCIYKGFQALPAIYVGHFVYQRNLVDRSGSKMKKIAPYLLVVVAFLIWYRLADDEPLFSLCVKRIVCEIIWGYAGICLAADTVNNANIFTEVIRKIGRYSFWIIIVHTVGMICIPWYLMSRSFPDHPNICFLIVAVLRSVGLFLGCSLMKYSTQKIRQIRRNKKRQKVK